MGTVVISTLLVGILIYAVNGYPMVSSINGSCCGIKNDNFKFSLSSQILSGVYNIANFCGQVAQGYCDAYSDGGGWLVVQRRKDGSVSFDRGWTEYEEGFGELNREFWYGLRPLNCLTSQGQWELRIDLTHSNGTKTYLHYKKFAVGSASDKYPLQISQFTGIYPVDPFSAHPLNNMKFTTKDNAHGNSVNCAINGDGGNGNGWWYNSCSLIYLNQKYSSKPRIQSNGWQRYVFTEMKIRPFGCNYF